MCLLSLTHCQQVWALYGLTPYQQHCIAPETITFQQAVDMVRFNAQTFRQHYNLSANCDKCVNMPICLSTMEERKVLLT